MKLDIHSNGFTIWVSAMDTLDWATKPGARWPCSTLAGKRFMACFDSRGLVDLTINGRYRAKDDIDGHEFSAIVADFADPVLPADHPSRFVAVDQFKPKAA